MKRNNLNPREESVIDMETLRINHRWQGFFSDIPGRVGLPIEDAQTNYTAEQLGAVLNDVLAEMRAQKLILPDTNHEDDALRDIIKAVCLIPGSGEFVYGVVDVYIHKSYLYFDSANTLHLYNDLLIPLGLINIGTNTDYVKSMNLLQSEARNVKNLSLVVSWFGDDLRCGNCSIKPKVDLKEKLTLPFFWKVSSQNRSSADLVTVIDDAAVFGGTPYDQGVVHAIWDAKARGIGITFYPFILMDVPSSNGLPNPYGTGDQDAFPWRGRITCYPGPDQDGTVDKTSAAGDQVSNFLGNAQLSQFSISGETVDYNGPEDWGYRRFILHYAHLCKAAGGVDTFIIGSELRGLTWIRDSQDHYPFVDGLIQLAADVKQVLGPETKVTYAADWSEYFGHQPPDGTGDVYFHLDPLWADSNIDAIGIDNYWPLSDWRDGDNHLDKLAGHENHDFDYLKGNVQGGEGYDYYYASQADRDNQVRTPITDGQGKPWMFRYKDIKNWWLNQHYNRPSGTEQGTPTAWVPQSKPIWFTEIGCPAVNKGSNQPNVFFDPLSSESAFPYYSDGERDDLMQRRHIQSLITYFDPNNSNYVDGDNPESGQYSGRMVDLDRIYIYAWDARPFPEFPSFDKTWGDTEKWYKGHWITGRVSQNSTEPTGRGLMAKRFQRAPRDPYVVDIKKGKINPQWKSFFESIERRTSPAIADLSAEPSAAELALATNQIIAVLRDQGFIAENDD